MSFKNKMKKRGISKIDSLIETPESISLDTPKYKKKPGWIIHVLPLASALAVTIAIALPISIHLLQGNSMNNSTNKGGGSLDPNYDSETEDSSGGGGSLDPNYNSESDDSSGGGAPAEDADPLNSILYNNINYSKLNPQDSTYSNSYTKLNLSGDISDIKGEKICSVNSSISPYLFSEGNYDLYHLKNSNSNGVLLVTNGKNHYFYCIDVISNMTVDLSFDGLLNYFGIDTYQGIDVYESERKNTQFSFLTKLTYTFDNNNSTSIVNSLKTIPSNFSIIEQRNKTLVRDDLGFPKGVNYRFVINDGVDCLPVYYLSQSCDLTICRSNFIIKDSEAFTIMDSLIEMDYDPNYII